VIVAGADETRRQSSVVLDEQGAAEGCHVGDGAAHVVEELTGYDVGSYGGG